eukprot:scpid82785/ scgid16947/ Sedoheptulokinase; Carbohydrate kinase-like protein
MDPESYVLGIDLGTTSVKVAVVDALNRQCVHRSMADTSAVVPNAEVKRSKEQNVTMIFATLDSLVSSVPAQHKEKIRMVSVCGQMHGCVLWGNNHDNEVSDARNASSAESSAAKDSGTEERKCAGDEQAQDSSESASSSSKDAVKVSSEPGRLSLPLSTPVNLVADNLGKNTSEGEATTPTTSTALSPTAGSSDAAAAPAAGSIASLAASPLLQAMPRVISTLVTWEDGRCDTAFLNSLPTPSNGRLSTGFGCATLAWMHRHASEAWVQQMCAAGTVMDLLVACLTSQQDAPVMSEQCAASWGYYNWEDRQWDLDALRDAGFPTRFLPRTSPAAATAGQLQWMWHGIRTGTPVSIASGDMQCGVYAAMHRNSQAVLNIGTSAQVACLLPKGHQLPATSTTTAAVASTGSSAAGGSAAAAAGTARTSSAQPSSSSATSSTTPNHVNTAAGKTAAAAASSVESAAATPADASAASEPSNGSDSSPSVPASAAAGGSSSSSSSPVPTSPTGTPKISLASATSSGRQSPSTCSRGDTTQCKSCHSATSAATAADADGSAKATSPTACNHSNGGGAHHVAAASASGGSGSPSDLTARLSKLKLGKNGKATSSSSSIGSTESEASVSAAASIPPLESWPYFFDQRLAVAASLNGGNVLMSFVEMLQAWVAELCAVAPHTDDVFAHLITAGQRRIREGASSRGDVIVVPRFFGERHRPQSRASVRELSPTSTSLGGIFTALCRGLIKNLNDMMPVSFLKECHVDCLVGTGTALLRNGVLQAAVVESYGMRVEAVPVDDATVGSALGAALAAIDTVAQATQQPSPKKK